MDIGRFVEGISVNLLSTFLWVLSVFLMTLLLKMFKRLYYYITFYRTRRLLFKGKDQLVAVLGTSKHISYSKKEYSSIDSNLALEVFRFEQYFRYIYAGKLNVVFVLDKNFSTKKYHENCVLIGGPGINKMTEDLIKLNLVDFQKLDNYKTNRVFFDSKGNKYGVSHTDNITTDYGVITVFANPHNTTKKIAVLYGIEGVGTLGVVQSIMNFSKLLSAAKVRLSWFKKYTTFSVLLEFKAVNGQVSKNVRIVDLLINSQSKVDLGDNVNFNNEEFKYT